MPNLGYKFHHWNSSSIALDTSSNYLTIDIANDNTFTAYFEKYELSFDVTPNPFNNELNVSYILPAKSQVSIEVLSLTGSKIADVIPYGSFQKAGNHNAKVSSTSFGPGAYFIVFKTNEIQKVVKTIKIN